MIVFMLKMRVCIFLAFHATHATAFKAMPISLELIVEREVAARAKRAVFDAWRGLVLPALRRRVEARWLSRLRFNGLLLRVLLRTWAGRPVQDS